MSNKKIYIKKIFFNLKKNENQNIKKNQMDCYVR